MTAAYIAMFLALMVTVSIMSLASEPSLVAGLFYWP
jgi:hypothetical protein